MNSSRSRESRRTAVPRGATDPSRAGDFRLARTCYDHLAGVLGVWVHERLVASGAIGDTATDHADIGLTPALEGLLALVGLEGRPRSRSRRIAYACRDLTERRHHVGGALGADLCAHMIARGWVERVDGTRTLRLTRLGRAELASRLGPLPSALAS